VRIWPFSRKGVQEGIAAVLALVNLLLLRVRDLEASLRSWREKAQKLEEQVQELKGRLAQNSQNSHRPPSRDPPDKPRPKSLRKESTRKPGGQPGHPGRTLQKVKDPDHTEVHRLCICPNCRGRAVGAEPAIDYEARQVFDLPKKLLEVTEHRAEIKCCPDCGESVKADFPEEVKAPVQYGPRFETLMVYCNQAQLIPYDRLSQMSEDIFGQPLSAGTVVTATTRLYDELEGFEKTLGRLIGQAAVVHADETGARVGAKPHWLHVASTFDLTFYGISAGRGRKAVDRFGILGACREWLMHDCYPFYFGYDQCLHAICNQHILRELQFLWEVQKQAWAKKLSDLLLRLHRCRKARGEFNERQFQRAHKQYLAIVAEGRRLHPPKAGAQSKAANLLDRLEDLDQSILAFLWDERVPFTNNLAEQDIRMMKVRQKISGCFRTFKGAQIFCRIRSDISTCRKQGVNVWQGLQMAVNGKAFIPSAPACAP
jgi:transposase